MLIKLTATEEVTTLETMTNDNFTGALVKTHQLHHETNNSNCPYYPQ